ncbi:MAG: preprotein translocase subunit SecG [Patescibacteria group bacterium]
MLWLNIILIIVSVVLTALILMQSRSAGLGSAFGGGAEGFYVRRGGEKRIFQGTIVTAVLFILIAFAHLFIR